MTLEQIRDHLPDYARDLKLRGVNIVATNNSYGGLAPFSQTMRDTIDAQVDWRMGSQTLSTGAMVTQERASSRSYGLGVPSLNLVRPSCWAISLRRWPPSAIRASKACSRAVRGLRVKENPVIADPPARPPQRTSAGKRRRYPAKRSRTSRP